MDFDCNNNYSLSDIEKLFNYDSLQDIASISEKVEFEADFIPQNDDVKMPDKNNDNIDNEINQVKEVKNQNSKQKNISTLFTTKKMGRKKKDSNEIGIHNKYFDDHIIQKIKTKIICALMNFINEIFASNSFEEKLVQIIGDSAKNTNTLYNRQLLEKSLKELFSVPVTKKNGKKYKEDHNIKILDKIYNENDPFVNSVLDRTFLECIKHFRGTESYFALQGLEKYYDLTIQQFEDDELYVKKFNDFLFNYEKKFEKRQTRKKQEK